MNSILKQQNLRRDLGIVSWKEADHDDKIEKLIDMNDILFERIVNFSSLFDVLIKFSCFSFSPHLLMKQQD
jgi:hypothetical protein